MEQLVYDNQEQQYANYGNSVPQVYSASKKLADMLNTLLDCDSWLEQIEHKLRGERWNPHLDEHNREIGFEQIADPLMNGKGVESIMTELRFRINPNFILTNLTEKDVFRIAKETRQGIINLIFLNGRNYGIDPSRRTNIVNMIDHEIFAMLKRSQDKTTIKLLQETVNIVQSSHQEQQRPNKKMFGII